MTTAATSMPRAPSSATRATAPDPGLASSAGALGTAETWADALRERRAEVSRDGVRLWLIVCGTIVSVLGGLDVASATVADPQGVRTRLLADLSAGLACGLLGTFGGERSEREHRAVAIGGLLGASALVSWHSVASFGGSEHLLLTVLGMAFALLVPVPRRVGLPVILGAHLTWPAIAIAAGGLKATDFGVANTVVDLVASVCIASTALLIHRWLYAGRTQALGELARLAEVDGLTGALNRRTIMDRLVRETERAVRYGGRCAIVMYDVDRFKRFNTDHGYAAGDRMLVHVVETLGGVLAQPRFAPLDGWLGRYGGEEFVVILPGATDAQALAFAEASRDAIAERDVALPSGVRVRTSTSVGVFGVDGREPLDPGVALKAADTALYRAKAAGGDRVCVASRDDAPSNATQPGVLAPPQIVRLPTTRADAPAAEEVGRIHATLLRGILALAGAWTLLFALRDLALWLEGGRVGDLTTLLAFRTVAGVAALLIATLSANLPHDLRKALIVHVGFGALGVVLVLVTMASTGGIASPHFGALVWLLLAWSVAFAAPATIALGLTAVAAVGLTLLFDPSSDGTTTYELTHRVAILLMTGIVTIGAEQRFKRLRTDEAVARDQLERLARVDPLTGLPNRSAFLRRAARLVRRAGPEAPVSILLFDLDHFKRLNDELGHLVGDEALTRVAEVLEATIRVADVAGRLGGEEFVAILPHTSAPRAALVGERLREALRYVVLSDGETRLSASFGVASWGRDETVSELLARADVALRDAKKAGRDCVVIAEGDAE